MFAFMINRIDLLWKKRMVHRKKKVVAKIKTLRLKNRDIVDQYLQSY